MRALGSPDALKLDPLRAFSSLKAVDPLATLGSLKTLPLGPVRTFATLEALALDPLATLSPLETLPLGPLRTLCALNPLALDPLRPFGALHPLALDPLRPFGTLLALRLLLLAAFNCLRATVAVAAISLAGSRRGNGQGGDACNQEEFASHITLLAKIKFMKYQRIKLADDPVSQMNLGALLAQLVVETGRLSAW